MKGLPIVIERDYNRIHRVEYVAEDGYRWIIERREVADRCSDWKGTPYWLLRRLGDDTPYIAWVEQSYDTSGDETTENPDWQALAVYVDKYKVCGELRAARVDIPVGGVS